MAVKGKWAQGIRPKNFHWIIKDRLAICERPGGYGENHRKIRRQEEIIWIRENQFAYVISLIGAPHNLHNYDDLGQPWRHRPFPLHDDGRWMHALFTEFRMLLGSGHKLLVHQEEVSERVTGLMAAYLVWTGLVKEQPKAITLVEHITGRQIAPVGRSLVATADRLYREGPPPEPEPTAKELAEAEAAAAAEAALLEEAGELVTEIDGAVEA